MFHYLFLSLFFLYEKARNTIDYLKKTIEELRRERAMEGLMSKYDDFESKGDAKSGILFTFSFSHFFLF